VVVDVDLAALGQIAAEPLGERGVVVGAVHREAAAVLAAGAVFELQRLQPAGVGVVLHARHVLADDLDRVCVELCGGLVAPRRLRAPGQDIHVVGHVSMIIATWAAASPWPITYTGSSTNMYASQWRQ